MPPEAEVPAAPAAEVPATPAPAPTMDAAAAATIAAATAAATETPAAPATDVDPFDAGEQTFKRDYVEKLRKEAAERRVALKPYEEAFQGYSEEDRTTWFRIQQQVLADPEAGAQTLEDVAKYLREGMKPKDAADAAGVEPAEGEKPEEKPMTKADVEKFFADQKKEAEINEASLRIETEAKAAGYEPGTTKYKLLLTRAIDMKFDLTGAIAAEKAEAQKIIDDFVQAQVARGEKWPATPGPAGSGAPNSGANEPKNIDQATAALRAKLNAEVGK